MGTTGHGACCLGSVEWMLPESVACALVWVLGVGTSGQSLVHPSSPKHQHDLLRPLRPRPPFPPVVSSTNLTSPLLPQASPELSVITLNPYNFPYFTSLLSCSLPKRSFSSLNCSDTSCWESRHRILSHLRRVLCVF